MTVLELARGGADLAAVISVHGSLQPAHLIAQTHAPKTAPSSQAPAASESGQAPTNAASLSSSDASAEQSSNSASASPEPHESLTQETSAPSIKPRILVCHGALDPHVPMSHVTAFADEMAAAHADYQLIIYGNALHGFTHETPSTTPGVAYNSQADARSSAHIRSFLTDVFH
jgi:dienelactone hydrolase